MHKNAGMHETVYTGASGADNPWELYSLTPGWQAASDRITQSFTEAVSQLDAAVAAGVPVRKAAETAWKAVYDVMGELRDFGAWDTEPRNHLCEMLERHLKAKHADDVTVDSLGNVEIEDEDAFRP